MPKKQEIIQSESGSDETRRRQQVTEPSDVVQREDAYINKTIDNREAEAEPSEVVKKGGFWEKVGSYWEKGKIIGRELISTKKGREVLANVGYRSIATTLGVKTITDIGLALRKKGDIYDWFKEQGESKEEKEEIGKALDELTKAVVKTNAAKKAVEEDIGTKKLAEVRLKAKRAKDKEARGEELAPEERLFEEEEAILTEMNLPELQAAAAGYKEALKNAKYLTKEERREFLKLLAVVLLEHKKTGESLESDKDKKVKEVFGTYLKTKIRGFALIRDGINTAITGTLIGVGGPVGSLIAYKIRAGVYGTLSLVERLQKGTTKAKKTELLREAKTRLEGLKRAEGADTKEKLEQASEKAEQGRGQRELAEVLKYATIDAARETCNALRGRGATDASQTSFQKGVDFARAAGTVWRTWGLIAPALGIHLPALGVRSMPTSKEFAGFFNQVLERLQEKGLSGAGESYWANAQIMADVYTGGRVRDFVIEEIKKGIQFIKEPAVIPSYTGEGLFTDVAEAATIKTTAKPIDAKPDALLLTEYTIRKGDSLWRIAKPMARRSGLSIPQVIEIIKKENNLSSDKIFAGQEIKVPVLELLQNIIKQSRVVDAKKLDLLNHTVNEAVGEPYSSQNDCMLFLKNNFQRAGAEFSPEIWSYAGKMIENIGTKVSGVNKVNILELKNHPGDYLVALGFRYQSAKNAPVLTTYNHAGHLKVGEDGSMIFTHASPGAIKTGDGKLINSHEHRLNYDLQGRPIKDIIDNPLHKDGTGWVIRTNLEEYLKNTHWEEVALTRLDGQKVALDSEVQEPLDLSNLSSRQQATIDGMKERPFFSERKQKANEYYCSRYITECYRRLNRQLPQELNLSVGDRAPIDAPEWEHSILASGGTVAAEMKEFLDVQRGHIHPKLRILSASGNELEIYKDRALEWIRQSAKSPLGAATFFHEGTKIENKIIQNLPFGGSLNSHVVFLLGERIDKGIAKTEGTIAQYLQNKYNLRAERLQKMNWVFKALGIKVNGLEATNVDDWLLRKLSAGDVIEVKDVAMNDKVGATTRAGGLIEKFFLKDHSFHPVSVLRPNKKILEDALSHWEATVRTQAVHQVEAGEMMSDICQKYQIPPKQQGDFMAYIYAQGFDAKNLREGTVIAIPDSQELQAHKTEVVKIAEERLAEQSWRRRKVFERAFVVASGDSPYSIVRRLFPDKKISRQEANWLLMQILERDKDKPDRDQVFIVKDDLIQLRAGDILRLHPHTVNSYWELIEYRRKQEKTTALKELDLLVKNNKRKVIKFTAKERSLIDNVLNKHPELNGHIPHYLSMILAREQKMGHFQGFGQRGFLKWVGEHFGWIPKLPFVKKVPVVGKHIRPVRSLGMFQVRAAEEMLKKIEEASNIKIHDNKRFRDLLINNKEVNCLAAALRNQEHIDLFQHALRAFGEQAKPGDKGFDLMILNSYNRGIGQTLYGTLELRMKDMASHINRVDIWQKYFNDRSITGKTANKERFYFRQFFQDLALELKNKGLLTVSSEQIQQDTSKIGTQIVDFLKSPTMQEVKQNYSRLTGQAMSLTMNNPADVKRGDFTALNYASVFADKPEKIAAAQSKAESGQSNLMKEEHVEVSKPDVVEDRQTLPLPEFFNGSPESQRSQWKEWIADDIKSILNASLSESELFLRQNRNLRIAGYYSKGFLPLSEVEFNNLQSNRQQVEKLLDSYFNRGQLLRQEVVDLDKAQWMLEENGDTVGDYQENSFQPGGIHEAYDIFAKEGTNIRAYTGGVVVASGGGWLGQDGKWKTDTGFSPSAGNAVLIYNPKLRTYSYYAHLREVVAKPGDIVNVGEKIGTVGCSGLTAENKPSHLHFEHKRQDDQTKRLIAERLPKGLKEKGRLVAGAIFR